MDKTMPHVSPRPVLSHTRFKVAHSLTQPDPEENSEVPFEPYEGILDKPKEDAEIVTNRKYTDFEIVNEQSIEFNHAAFGNHDEVEEVNERNKNKKVEPKYMREEQESFFFELVGKLIADTRPGISYWSILGTSNLLMNVHRTAVI